MWQFFFLFLFLFLLLLLWVSEWVSEWVSCVAPTIVSSGSPHRVWERERESKRAQVCLCAAVHLLTPIHACTQHTLTLTHTRYALNIRSAAALLCSAAAPIEIVACAAVELSVQFEQRYRAVWRPLSLSVILCKQNVFAFKVSKSSSNNL